MTDLHLIEGLARIHDRLAAADVSVAVHGLVGGLRYEVVGCEEVSPFPSGNPNRARWYHGELDEVLLEEAISRFDAHGVPLWFLHAWAEDDRAQVEDCCERYDLERFTGTTYPLLAHDLQRIDEAPTALRIAEIGPVPAGYAGMLGGPLHGGPAVALADQGAATFFGAWDDDDELVALAGLVIDAGTAYLGWAVTREDRRGEGAHGALIRARLHHARERGSHLALTETLGMLQTSLGNLERAGFRKVADRLVMGCGEME